ncbi:proline racemase family protein [Saccharopolyspora phatthalungensis]|uniref:Proline racemase n=1 Tax=Saccharopolyspora phatthalungensis TaxID=664693 RepID=A0A840Q9N4_9PSEU|nr:proline racemase family protein [Saccharopolyspora phatthalungensis]MBB5157146.1 proline racemase [Saccharopolyspora phatthalungensis]
MRPGLDVVDTHTAGNPTRIVIGGLDVPAGIEGVEATRRWLRDSADWVRRRLVHEPRGGGLTCAVLPLPAAGPDHDIGAVILEPGSYPPMCGHCMIGLSMVIDEFDLLPDVPRIDGARGFTIATPAGLVGSSVRGGGPAATEVTLTNVDSYVVDRWEQKLGGCPVGVDLLWGGDYYATVDADDLGLRLEPESALKIVGLARELAASIADQVVRDPRTGTKLDVYQVMFHRTIDAEAPTSRVVVVAPPGEIDRSPCGTGSSALLSLRVARGDVAASQTLTTRSIIDTVFKVRTDSIADDAGRVVVRPLLTGTAHVTGFSRVVADPYDRLCDGFSPI